MRRNWAGNYVYSAPRFEIARTVPQVQEYVSAARKLTVMGTGHSFNSIADSEEIQLSLRPMDRVTSLDAAVRRVTVEGGARYGDIAPNLHRRGFALANLASLPHISIAGAVATATHGSGSTTGNLATAVAGLDVVTATGDLVHFSREANGGAFGGAVVSLGALGVVVGLTLDIEPTYDICQTVYPGLPFDVLTAEFDAVMAAGKSVSVFTDWRGAQVGSVWVKARRDAGAPAPDLFGTPAATENLHPLPDGRAEDCTEQIGRPGPWHERLPHFRMEFTPSNGAEIQAEYFMPRDAAPMAIAAMRKNGDILAPILMASEIRTVAGDDIWMSPGHRGNYLAFHFTFHRNWEAIRKVLPVVEASLAPFGPLPHWGKVTTMDPATVRAGYAGLDDFRHLVATYDPAGKFRNRHIDLLLFDDRA